MKFNQHIRAVPGGYYTGLINDMHKDYKNFQEKSTFLQMEYLKPLLDDIKQTTQSINHTFDEKKFDKLQAPITLNSLSIHCTLPFDYQQLENLSPLKFLIIFTKPSIYREQVIRKLVRKIQRDTNIEYQDAKDILREYFNQYKTDEEISKLFHFLDIQIDYIFQLKEIIILCCYAERYFLHDLSQREIVIFTRSIQEQVDFEFLKRKFHGINLSKNLRNLIETLQEPKDLI